jgi:ribosome biogenesis protein Nip4
MEVFTRIQEKRNPYCLGICIGDLVEDKFLPSIEGATLCSPFTTRKVKVSYKGEQAVLYGRHIKLAFVADFSSTICRGEKILVANTFGEIIAIGKALVDGKEFPNLPKEKTVLENIIDRGWYLRKGA